jgi:hypothetical protein
MTAGRPSMHLWNLLQSAWELLRNALSTSTLSIIVFSVCVPVAIFIATIGLKWYGQPQRTLATFWTTARNWIKPALLGIGVTAFAWLVLGSWAICKTVANDHQNLAGRLRVVVNEKNRLKAGLAERDRYIEALTEDINRLRSQAPGQRPKNNQTAIPPGTSIQQKSTGPCSPTIVGSGNTNTCNPAPPARHLTGDQFKALQAKSIRAVCTLSHYPDPFYDEMITIRWEPTTEATNYASEFVSALGPSVGLRVAFGLDHESRNGLFLGTTDWTHPDACASMLKLAFDASKISYKLVPLTPKIAQSGLPIPDDIFIIIGTND